MYDFMFFLFTFFLTIIQIILFSIKIVIFIISSLLSNSDSSDTMLFLLDSYFETFTPELPVDALVCDQSLSSQLNDMVPDTNSIHIANVEQHYPSEIDIFDNCSDYNPFDEDSSYVFMYSNLAAFGNNSFFTI